SKLLKPLDNFASIGAQPTLFQKRATLRKNLANNGGSDLGLLGAEGGGISSNAEDYNGGKMEASELNKKKRKLGNGEDVEDFSIDVSGLNYDSDDFMENNYKVEESGKNSGNSSNVNSTVTGGDQKGKKKGLPAKNLMAERRRRKKLNDRLYSRRRRGESWRGGEERHGDGEARRGVEEWREDEAVIEGYEAKKRIGLDDLILKGRRVI
ncbi:hypothetical protein U1Q18_019591, partial [Sarracenia purpurea var. burkii]